MRLARWMGRATSAPDAACAKKTCDLGVTVSVKPMSSNKRRSCAKVILGLRMPSLSTQSALQVVLVARDLPKRAGVEPVSHRDANRDGFATGKQFRRTPLRDIRLDVHPVRPVLVSIIHDQDHGIGFLEPQLEIA